MNAPVVLPRETRKPVFPAVVHTYTDALRVLCKATAPMTAAQLADATVRDKANLRRDLHKLRDAGVIAQVGDASTITAKGRDWVRGQDLAEGLLVLADPNPPTAADHGRSGVQRAPFHAFRRNPDQPRKTFDPVVIAGIADTIVAAGDLLQPTLVRPRNAADPLDGDDANPIRMLWAGEQRLRAVELLIEQDRLPAALDPVKGGGIPYVERDAEPGSTAFLALIENGARAPLDPLEEAFAFVDYMNDTGITSARQVAINTGRAGKGDEKGVRTVQIRIKVAREATPEAIDEYRHTRDWNRLVETVQQKGETQDERRAREIRQGCSGLMGRRRLALIELAHKAVLEPLSSDARPMVATSYNYVDPTGAVSALVQFAGGVFSRDEARVSDVATAWLIDEGLLDLEDPARTLAAAWREHQLLESTITARLESSPIIWSTEWLNVTPAPEAVTAADDPALFDLPPPDSVPAKPLPAMAIIALAEVLHASGYPERSPEPIATAYRYWLDGNLSVMKDAGLVAIVHAQAQPPRILLHPEGVAALNREAAARGMTILLPVGDDALNLLRQSLIGFTGEGYVTDWLNAAPSKEEMEQAVTFTVTRANPPGRDDGEAPNHEDLEEDEAVAAAGQVLITVDRAMASLPVEGFARLMTAAGLDGPFKTRPDVPGAVFDSKDDDLLVLDQHGALPDDLVRARATLVSAALNAASGAGVPLTLKDLPDGEDKSTGARVERALGRVRDWMAWNYEGLHSLPDVTDLYSEISEALNASRYDRRAAAERATEGTAQ